LAQYFPDDLDDPEYPELEKNYYKFRRGLEQRYPQICDKCEPKMIERLEQAGYTAKTDHLRRMMDRSRAGRQASKQWTYLDLFNTAGRWIWLSSLVFELLWHASSISMAIRPGLTTGNSKGWIYQRIVLFQEAVGALPSRDWLMRLSLWANILTIWWNPQFVQVFRGFSKHILGLTQWYTFQSMILFIRIIFGKVDILQIGGRNEMRAEISAHLFMSLLMTLVSIVATTARDFANYLAQMYTLARRSVRVDTSPLFGSSDTPISPPKPKLVPQAKDTKNLSNILDEILASPTPGSVLNANTTLSGAVPGRSRSGAGPQRLQESPSLQLGSLGLSDEQHQTRLQEVQYDEEMDWSPTQSPYRAFNDYGSSQRQRQGFGQTPTEPNPNPFWYKIPPAPVDPSRRLRNPPNVPILRSKPAKDSNVLLGGRSDKAAVVAGGSQLGSNKRRVEFRDTQYFAPQDPTDPRNSLADMLSQSFSLSQEPGDEPRSRAKSNSARSSLPLGLRTARLMDVLMLAVMVLTWLYSVSAQHEYQAHLLVGVMTLCFAIAVRVTADTIADIRRENGMNLASGTGVMLGAVEAAASVHFGLEIWRSNGECTACTSQGTVLIGAMLIHQIWNVIM
jgi:hypothetical protein